MKKILFLIPNFKWIDDSDERTIWNIHPYGICMIAANLETRYQVHILDANFENLSMQSFIKTVEKIAPDIVGISVLTSEYAATGHLAAKTIKAINSSIVVILGGVHATTQWDEIADPNIDYVFVGEGEIAFTELLDDIFTTATQSRHYQLLANKFSQKIVKSDRIDDLDTLPLPAYHLVDYGAYSQTSPRESVDEPRLYPYGRIMTSRGCPINCVFCQVRSIMGEKFRTRSPENILTEIEYLIDTYGIKYLVFDDDNLFLNKNRAKKIFQLMIDKNLNLRWHPIATAVYALDREILELARQSGLQYVDLAIESGVERVLKDIINKPVVLEQAKEIVSICAELGIDTAANFIIGFPGETWDEIRQTLSFAEELDPDYCKFFIANPLYGTRLYHLALQQNVLTQTHPKNSWFFGTIKTDEFSPENIAILRAYEWDRINFTKEAKRNKIAQMMNISTTRLDEIRKSTLRKANDMLKMNPSQ